MVSGSRILVVADTCCLINLYAAGDPASILPALQYGFWMPSAAAREALYIRQPDKDNPALLVQKPVDLAPLIQAGHLQLGDLAGAEEAQLFIQLAAELADGEAACIAVARCRGWTLATDDRKARRIAEELDVALTSTPELMKRWAEMTNADSAAIRTMLRNVQAFARFSPGPHAPMSSWWFKQLA